MVSGYRIYFGLPSYKHFDSGQNHGNMLCLYHDQNFECIPANSQMLSFFDIKKYILLAALLKTGGRKNVFIYMVNTSMCRK